jgi:hypothetical protein
VGFGAARCGRATGASIVTGGRLDCCASAGEKEAAAMRPATADTLPTELTSSDLSIDPAATTVRNDLGTLALLMKRSPNW